MRLFSEVGEFMALAYRAYADHQLIFLTDREPTLQERLEEEGPRAEVGRALKELAPR